MTPRDRHRYLAVAVLLLSGLLALALAGGHDHPPAAQAAVPQVSPTTPAAAVVPDASSPQPARAAVARPVRVVIPAIGVHTRLEQLGLDRSGALQPPVDPARAGWYADGPVPGDQGPAVVAGHVDSTHGPAVFWRLGNLRPGNRVTVALSDGSNRAFVVTEVRRVALHRFPTAEVYGPTPDRALRLITCGGSYDHVKGRYRSNIVVFALAL